MTFERVRFTTLPAPIRSFFDGLLRIRRCTLRDSDLTVRFVLLVVGVAGLTASRTVSFIGQSPSDRVEPPIPPLIWLFHIADMLVLPGANRLLPGSPVAYVQTLTLAVSLLCFFFAVRSTVPAFLKRIHAPLTVAALLIAIILMLVDLQGTLPYGVVAGKPTHYGNDAISVNSCATDSFLMGRNPYQDFRVVPCLSKYFDASMVAIKTTPLQAGAFRHTRTYPSVAQLTAQFKVAQARREVYPTEFESYYSYPAASFLLTAPLVALHLQDLSLFYLACYLGIAVLAIWQSRGMARLAALLVVGANAALWPTMSAGATDGLYALLVLLAWRWRDHRWMSALVLGLAVASRQQAWFFALFYAVLVARTMDRRELVLRFSVIVGVFAALNLPFIIASPEPWLKGVLGPMIDPMFPRGTGIIALSIYGAGSLPLGPRWFYSLLEAVALGASLWYYWRVCRLHPAVGLVLAPLSLFFAWRSLYSYFLPLSLIVLYVAFTQYREPTEPVQVTTPSEVSPSAEEAIVAA